MAPRTTDTRSAARPGRVGRRRWLLAVVAVLGVLILGAFLVLASRLAKKASAKRAAQGVALAQRRSGESPGQVAPAQARPRPAESDLPAVPTPLPPPSRSRVPDDASSSRGSVGEPFPLFPAGRFVIEASDAVRLTPVPGHLFVDTQPHGAQVWVDGEWKGQTPLDFAAGAGTKQLVVVAVGHHLFRESFDAARGSIFRRALAPVTGPVQGNAFLNVFCRTSGRFPIFVDRAETGLLCPSSRVPVSAGKHWVGVYAPKERKLVEVEITVQAGATPVEVNLAP
jgi:hypothetical protein